MKCQHCDDDHQLQQRDWPESWTEDRRKFFADRLLKLGVLPAYIPVMAFEVQRMACESHFKVMEQDLFEYLRESNEVAARVRNVDQWRDWFLGWSLKIVKPLKPKHDDTMLMTVWRIGLLILCSVPLLVLTLPIRVPFAVYRWAVYRQLHPFFINWLEVHGVRKDSY